MEKINIIYFKNAIIFLIFFSFEPLAISLKKLTVIL